MKKLFATGLALALALAAALVHAQAPEPYGATPSDKQLRWHEMQMYAFLHFTVNTFTDKEWGYGDESPAVFNPTDFNPDQIVEAVKAAGMRGVILTAKHHDGFCLWPTKTTEHSVAHSTWKGGKGDVVRDMAEACKRHGLKFGVYLSPWDRNSAQYGRPEYLKIYRDQLRELLTNYGDIFEVWHDGANGGDGYYGGAREKRLIDRRTYYDWPTTWKMVQQLQPHAVIFSDVGPDIRWVGNEKGFADTTNWATYEPVGENNDQAAPGYVKAGGREGQTGHRGRGHWLPAECDVSIRPGWFFHASENDRVKSPSELLALYYNSVGRGCNLLLNIPPDTRGQLHDNDVASLKRFGELLRQTFETNLAAAPAAKVTPLNAPEVVVDFGGERKFTVIRLRENIALGQRVEEFAVDAWQGDTWKPIASGTSIGPSRLLRLDVPQTASKVRLRITKTPVAPALADFSVFAEPSEARPQPAEIRP
jgi:alpha-L-fucosidase